MVGWFERELGVGVKSVVVVLCDECVDDDSTFDSKETIARLI